MHKRDILLILSQNTKSFEMSEDDSRGVDGFVHDSSGPHKEKSPMRKLEEVSISVIIDIFQLWSLIILPGGGFIVGMIIKSCLALFLGWKHNNVIEIWLVHLFTMIFMIGTLNSIVFAKNGITDPKEKAFFVCFSYLLLFGIILGLAHGL